MVSTKSERFELRLDTESLEKIDNWRSSQEDIPSRAESVRLLIEKGLLNESALSTGEKIIISMLKDISSKVKANTDIDPDFVMDAISNGHIWALRWTYPGIFESEPVSEKTVHEVADILDMWSFIHFSYENLNTEEKEYIKNKCPYIKEKPVFIGFDGNRESIYLSIADFLINKMERFVELKRKSLNSHMPMLSKYRIMLNIFSPIQDRLCGETLSKEQLVEIMSV